MYYCIFRKPAPHELVAYPTTPEKFKNEWVAALATLDGAVDTDYIRVEYDGELPQGMILALDDRGNVKPVAGPKAAARKKAKSVVRLALNKLGLSNADIDRAGIGL